MALWKNLTWQGQDEPTRTALTSLSKTLSAATITQVVKTTVSATPSSLVYVDAWAAAAADLILPAVEDDWIQLSASFTWTNNATVQGGFDFQVVGTSIYVASTSTTPADEGLACCRGNISAEATYGHGVGGTVYYQVGVNDVTNGNVTFRPRINANAANRGISAGANFPAHFAALNVGHGAV